MKPAEIKSTVLEKMGLRLGVNKLNEIARLVYEISVIKKCHPKSILNTNQINHIVSNKLLGYHDKFSGVKKYLLGIRYPGASSQKDFRPYFSKLAEISESIQRPVFDPKTVYVEAGSNYRSVLGKIQSRCGQIEVVYIDSIKDFIKSAGREKSSHDLFISDEKWDFIKACPCTAGAQHCGYSIVNLGFGCPFDCSYCYLQHYKNVSGIIINPNIDEYIQKLGCWLAGKKTRIGTGEFTDSLALDHLTGHAKLLVEYFSTTQSLLELKTKSNNISALLGLNHRERTVAAWSLNPQRIIDSEERFTVSLSKRLEAAKLCAEAGYPTAFHFDPIIYYEGWKKDYQSTLDELFDTIKAPLWISLGTLRFNRSMKQKIESRKTVPDYIYSEMILGDDLKLRYSESLRREIYAKMFQWIRKRNSAAAVYLCMESGAMWNSVLGYYKTHWMK